MFFYSFAVGIFVGLAVGWTGNRIRAYLTNPMYFTVFMVTTPFIAFLISEQLEIAEGFKGSGVVAVVVAAIYLTYNGPDTITAQNRFYGLPIWAFISFVLNGALFVLVGVQLPDLSCRSLVTQDFLDYCCGGGGYVGLGGDGLTGDLDGDLA